MKKQIIWEEDEGVGNIILNDPPSNKMNGAFFTELEDLTMNVIPDSNVKAIVIYGKGRHYSSGADVEELINRIHLSNENQNSSPEVRYPDFLFQNNRSFMFFQNLEIPVISAIRGVCFGSALEFALFSHIRLCAEGALLGFPEVSFNLIPGCGGIQKLASIVGISKSLEIVLTGVSISAAEASNLKIVDAVLPKKKVIDIAKQFAGHIAKGYSKYRINSYISEMMKENKFVTSFDTENN